MRRFLVSLLLLLVLGTGTACTTAPSGSGSPDLDGMLARLRTTTDPVEAENLELAIRHIWARSGRSSIDHLMQTAVSDIHAGDTDQALSVLDKVVEADPRYVEGWNLRATVHYLRDEYGPAIDDIEHVLTLEPRHFPALAGLGRIMLALDDKKMALKAFQAALAINPHLDSVREEADSLEDQVAGLPI